jgi:membrane fusion protein (multidrug efflux system)
VTRTQQGDTLSVVGADGKISQRNVKISAAKDNQWVVLDGLKAGEQVMVDGFQKLQMMPPGTPVKAVPWKKPDPNAAAAPAAAASAPAAAPAAGGQASAPAEKK